MSKEYVEQRNGGYYIKGSHVISFLFGHCCPYHQQ